MAGRTSNDGKGLEDLVATIEGLLVPRGFRVERNDRVYSDDGVQIAELDIVIRGKVGSADFSWLMECRSRPSIGPAPESWIEQLVGRRQRFRFDKVTAVSTTGFASGAAEYAPSQGIDLRQLNEVAPDVIDWLGFRSMRSRQEHHVLHHACLRIGDESPERQQAFLDAEPLLRATDTGTVIFADVIPNGPPKRLCVRIQYPHDGSHFVVNTTAGPVRII
ncbi:MAG: hypothetical protein EXQ52_00530 [Bryobacterales bacterium]|nr:hypothetical protein [Bryobacterales bacterium]